MEESLNLKNRPDEADKLEMEAQLRRFRDKLSVSGTGVIILGFWNILKTMMYLMRPTMYEPYIPENASRQEIMLIMVLGAVMAFLVLAFEVSIRIYIGRSAIDEGRRGRKHKLIIPLAFFEILFSIFSIMNTLFSSSFEESQEDIWLSSLIMEIACLVALIDMMRYMFMARKIERRLQG